MISSNRSVRHFYNLARENADSFLTLTRAGREWGVSTGRKRRCGWLDLVVLKYSAAINHYTVLNLTKLDVLDTFAVIKVRILCYLCCYLPTWFFKLCV